MLKKGMKTVIMAVAVAALIIGLFSREERKETYKVRSYSEIMESGYLSAVTEYNAIGYQISQDTIAGFDYELLKTFAKAKGIEVKTTPVMSFKERMDGVLKGKYDLLASETLVNSSSKDSLLFTRTLMMGKQVLVQRKPDEKKEKDLLKSVLDLKGKVVHVTKESPTILRMQHLMEEIADTIYIEEVEKYSSEQLIAMVAGGDIDYAVCNEDLARKALKEFNNIDISTDISFTQFYAWGASRKSGELIDSINAWLDVYINSEEYRKLYRKYYKKD